MLQPSPRVILSSRRLASWVHRAANCAKKVGAVMCDLIQRSFLRPAQASTTGPASASEMRGTCKAEV